MLPFILPCFLLLSVRSRPPSCMFCTFELVSSSSNLNWSIARFVLCTSFYATFLSFIAQKREKNIVNSKHWQLAFEHTLFNGHSHSDWSSAQSIWMDYIVKCIIYIIGNLMYTNGKWTCAIAEHWYPEPIIESDCLNFLACNLEGWDYYGWMRLFATEHHVKLREKTTTNKQMQIGNGKNPKCTNPMCTCIHITKFNAKGHFKVVAVAVFKTHNRDVHKHVLWINVSIAHTRTLILLAWFTDQLILQFTFFADICLLMQMAFAAAR